MNIKFIIAAVVIILVYIAYPKYMMMKREDQVRAFLKGPFAEEVEKEAQSQVNIKVVELDILNHYPNFRVYQKYSIEASKLPQLPANIDHVMKRRICDQVNLLTNYQGNAKDLQALKNVLEEDKVTFFITVQDKFGQEIIEFKQQLSECSRLDSEISVRSEIQKPALTQPVEAAPAVTAPADAAATVN